MDSRVQPVTVRDVERRFLADKKWWSTRLILAGVGGAGGFILAVLLEDILSSAVVAVFVSALTLILIFREDHLFFGHTYKIGAKSTLEMRNRIWVEQPGEFSAHEGSVIVIVRVAGIFRPRRSITVSDGGETDNPFGRTMKIIDDGTFLIDRLIAGTANGKHIEDVIFLLLEDQRAARHTGTSS